MEMRRKLFVRMNFSCLFFRKQLISTGHKSKIMFKNVKNVTSFLEIVLSFVFLSPEDADYIFAIRFLYFCACFCIISLFNVSVWLFQLISYGKIKSIIENKTWTVKRNIYTETFVFEKTKERKLSLKHKQTWRETSDLCHQSTNDMIWMKWKI